ncbi:HD family phosphohydrolase [Sphaerospermopsis aphanizomenoides BCCUSP55]|uniref:HD family phosphohydrolase n=1 Tax=Sphaerospermopsis aphanizomenoides TaxID=459663 RepID=UPI000A887511|nr:HD family phosphohydrolase [Sphaerospermopsis aphanizomenoides]MBK1987474.1 HD family phosphohydrolase [Sphaerospermopsis aphanizomenoides BCCUSP55]
MKTQQFWQSLTQQLRQWRRQYKVLCRKGKILGSVSNSKNPSGNKKFFKHLILYLLPSHDEGGNRQRRKAPPSTTQFFPTHHGICAVVFNWLHKKRSVVILLIAVVSLTGVIGHEFYNQPQMRIGTVAPQTFIALYSTSIEDKEKTEAKRKAVKTNSQPVLMINTQINQQINENLRQILEYGHELRAVAGYFPFANVTILSVTTQRYLRSCLEPEWQQLKIALETYQKQNDKLLILRSSPTDRNLFSRPIRSPLLPLSPPKIKEESNTGNPDFDQALAELKTYSINTSAQNLSSLIAQISEIRQGYKQASEKLVKIEAERQEIIYTDTFLLELSEDDWIKTQMGIHQSAERMLTQGIPPGLPRSILQDAVSLQVQVSVPGEAESLATKILLAVLKPNLQQDEEQTKQQAEIAADQVPSVMQKVRQGQVIVSKGEKITAWNFDVLEYYHLIRRELNWLALTGLAVLVSAAIGVFVRVERRLGSHLRERDRLLILLLTLSIPSVLAMGVNYTTWSAIGLLLGSFYGRTVGVTVVVLLLLILPINMEINLIGLVAGAAGGILSSYVAQRFKSREELAFLGIVIALTQGSIYLLLNILIGAAFVSAWYTILQDALLFGLSGLAWSVIALGLSPYLEKLFDLITPIRLAELANPNRPLLKRLATETPGTFQHTLFVATLAETAAKKLRCNVELVRAGTLYHDIGKMHDPLGFIENQMGGPNKHETEIKDPWQSAAIIKKHVTEGLVMAKKHSLPTAIQAFIPEHQGTMAIAYFYHQAQQMAKDDPSIIVNKADFCYDGPIPQSRETGIVMLADSCEAALRSLKDATPEQALNMLNNIIRAKWQDQQLIDSGLTKEEMSKIAQIFVDVWQQFHHKRIAYPKSKTGSEK